LAVLQGEIARATLEEALDIGSGFLGEDRDGDPAGGLIESNEKIATNRLVGQPQ